MQLACGVLFIYTRQTSAGHLIINLNKNGMAKKLSLKPLGDRVVVRPTTDQGEKRLASGIIIPETVNKEKLFKGEVTSVGLGRRNDKGERIVLEVKPGDTVYFKKPWDEPIKMDGVEYYVLSESDIILIEA